MTIKIRLFSALQPLNFYETTFNKNVSKIKLSKKRKETCNVRYNDIDVFNYDAQPFRLSSF